MEKNKDATKIDSAQEGFANALIEDQNIHFRGIDFKAEDVARDYPEYIPIFRGIKDGSLDVSMFRVWKNDEVEKLTQKNDPLRVKLIAWISNVAQYEYSNRELDKSQSQE